MITARVPKVIEQRSLRAVHMGPHKPYPRHVSQARSIGGLNGAYKSLSAFHLVLAHRDSSGRVADLARTERECGGFRAQRWEGAGRGMADRQAPILRSPAFWGADVGSFDSEAQALHIMMTRVMGRLRAVIH